MAAQPHDCDTDVGIRFSDRLVTFGDARSGDADNNTDRLGVSTRCAFVEHFGCRSMYMRVGEPVSTVQRQFSVVVRGSVGHTTIRNTS